MVFSEQGNSVSDWDDRSALRMRLRSWTAFFQEGIIIFWNVSDTKDYRKSYGSANIYLGEEERSFIKVLQDFTTEVDADVKIFNLVGDRDRLVPWDKNSVEAVKRYRELGGEAALEIIPYRGHGASGEEADLSYNDEIFYNSKQAVNFLIRD